jgi:cytosine/adenosine deaminase-related metal-dependent hydrolase
MTQTSPTPADFDLVVRNARVATASDTFDADIGIRDGRIVQLGAGLARGAREIDAAGRVVTPGGVDAHCHLDQPMEAPARMWALERILQYMRSRPQVWVARRDEIARHWLSVTGASP